MFVIFSFLSLYKFSIQTKRTFDYFYYQNGRKSTIVIYGKINSKKEKDEWKIMA